MYNGHFFRTKPTILHKSTPRSVGDSDSLCPFFRPKQLRTGSASFRLFYECITTPLYRPQQLFSTAALLDSWNSFPRPKMALERKQLRQVHRLTPTHLNSTIK